VTKGAVDRLDGTSVGLPPLAFGFASWSIEFVMNELGVSRLSATRYLDELVRIGLLDEQKMGRDNYYINVALYDLLGNVYQKSVKSMHVGKTCIEK
jgi:DNA-binding IclR family transcriptional regulator